MMPITDYKTTHIITHELEAVSVSNIERIVVDSLYQEKNAVNVYSYTLKIYVDNERFIKVSGPYQEPFIGDIEYTVCNLYNLKKEILREAVNVLTLYGPVLHDNEIIELIEERLNRVDIYSVPNPDFLKVGTDHSQNPEHLRN